MTAQSQTIQPAAPHDIAQDKIKFTRETFLFLCDHEQWSDPHFDGSIPDDFLY